MMTHLSVQHKIDFLSWWFVFPGGPFGYNEVAMIPAGATHIRVTDNSKSYLGRNEPHTHTRCYDDSSGTDSACKKVMSPQQ